MTSVRTGSRVSLLFLCTVQFCGCSPDLNYPYGVFPEKVSFFLYANTVYDDMSAGYNPVCAGPNGSGYCEFPLYVSSNRLTQGNNFDIFTMTAMMSFDAYEGEFSLRSYTANYAWTTSSSPANEYAPFVVNYAGNKIYFHTGDANGNLDIYYTTASVADIPVSALNSGFDDAFLTFFDFENAAYFSSNRGGNFDLYSVTVPAGANEAWLSSPMVPASAVAALNTPASDTCPFIIGKLLVFASDRPGGFGGFDLYYSVHGASGWSAPVNFGPSINTAHDEYGPIVISDPDYLNDLLIFSSNRPGGMGGYDFYYIGIPEFGG